MDGWMDGWIDIKFKLFGVVVEKELQYSVSILCLAFKRSSVTYDELVDRLSLKYEYQPLVAVTACVLGFICWNLELLCHCFQALWNGTQINFVDQELKGSDVSGMGRTGNQSVRVEKVQRSGN
ncbi:hypothetical protein NPIL_191501 [Nephila pilipes]|uniref:Uncharacterized protein n=1 Tax=Nephila pilipes TaxID=299642 RepID=A0A8X6QU49_NEPPI|nr:hypothetical protein NPIL_191501 [Nephila pilipes]